MLKKGVFCLSIDVELLWGRHNRNWKKFVPVVAQSRSIIKVVLELLEEYKIGATWAIVGHLFLDSCRPVNGIKHPEVIRPRYRWYQKDWFAGDPASSIKNDPGWYGRDIVRMIKKYPRQEIACHSFSHVIFGDPGCSRKCVESELAACVELAKKDGVKLTSFVFPHNYIGHLDVLIEYGFTAYRGREINSFRHSKLSQLITLFSPLSPPVHTPTHNEGLVNIPASMYLPSSRGLRRFIPNHLIVAAAKRGIDRAVKEGNVFHLWTHPEDLVGENHRIHALDKILSYAASFQTKKKLTIISMASIV